MNRRPLAFRLAAALLAGWLGLALVDPPAVDACPMRDGSAAGARAATPAVPMSGMGVHGAPTHPSGGGARGAPAAPSPHSAHVVGCMCPGACAHGLSAWLGLAPRSVSPGGVRSAPVLTAAPAGPARGPATHFLPFAQAPPLLA